MKTKFLLLLSYTVLIACQQTVDPFDKPFSCILTQAAFSDGNTTNELTSFQYDDSDRLISVLYSDNSSEVFNYSSNSLLATWYFYSTTGILSSAKEIQYDQDLQVVKVIDKNSNGQQTSEERFSRSSTSLKIEAYVNSNKLAWSEEWTLVGKNNTRDYLQVFDQKTGKTSYTSEYLFSNFDDGVSPFYAWVYKIPGFPYPRSFNTYKTANYTSTNYTNGNPQSPYVTQCTYEYTYNKSKGTLTRVSSCSDNGGTAYGGTRSYTYSNCD